MKTSTKFAGYLFVAGVMTMSPISAFAAEGAGTNGLTFYDYLSTQADKDTVIDFNEAPATGNVVEHIDALDMDVTMSDIGGLYMLQDTKDDDKPMYFYRGNVTDNNVILNDMCWLIVRTTETGGTKLLYNGTPTADGQCLGDPDWTMDKTIAAMSQIYSGSLTEWPKTNIGASQFNASYHSPSDMYYMYGERYESEYKRFISNDTVFGNDVTYSNGQYTLQDTVTGGQNAYNGHHYTCLTTGTTCSEVYYENYSYGPTDTGGFFLTFTDGDALDTALAKMAENKNDSIIKTFIENWYAENMTDATDYLEDTIWYGSKTFASGALSTKDSNFGSNFDRQGASYTDTMLDIYYHGANRADDSSLRVPSLNAVNFDYTDENGIYTVANGALKYPVGMLTSSEMIMAGNGYPAMAKGTYIDDNFFWWGLSPLAFGGDYTLAGAFVGLAGVSDRSNVDAGIGVRPSVSLKSTLGALDGDGSRENPFTALAEVAESEDEEGETPAEGGTTPANPQTSDYLYYILPLLLISTFAIASSRKLITRGRK